MRSTGAIVGDDDGDAYNATRVDFVSSKLTSFLTELTTGEWHSNVCQTSITIRHRI